MKTRQQQRGISLIGLIFVAAVLGCAFLIGAQVFPTVLEYQAIVKAVNKAAMGGTTVGEIRTSYEKTTAIDNITSVEPKDLVITKEGDKTVVSFAYNKEISLFGPAYLLLKYSGRSK